MLCGLKEVKPCVFLPLSVEIVVDIHLVINSSSKWQLANPLQPGNFHNILWMNADPRPGNSAANLSNMKQIFPSFATEIDVNAAYRTERLAHSGRPWVMANMVSSLDGAGNFEGKSGPLSSPKDREIFHFLRSLADIVLIGAATVKVENYGPTKNANGPAIAVVSNQLSFDWNSPLFTENSVRPFIITCEKADPALRTKASQFAEVLVTGDQHVDLSSALKELALRDKKVVLCEGGPTLLGQLVEENLLDELCLTLSPILVGDQGHSIIKSKSFEPRSAQPVMIMEDQGSLFMRYLIEPS